MFAAVKLSRLAAACLFLAPFLAAAQSSQDDKPSSPAWYNPSKYNPMKLIHRNAKSASDQLASDDNLEHRLTSQLQTQGVLSKNDNLQDKCSTFKSLQTCLAVLRASKSLKIEFACLKWDVTGAKPSSVSDACAGPSDRKAMSFRDSIALLKPDCDAKDESAKALKAAHDDIKDATS